jgi:uncharacterized protein (DUF1697 family)
MMVHIALLRAVNIGPHGKVAMADLKAMMAGLGFAAQPLLQSGNLVFDGGRQSGADLEALLEAEAAKRLGLKTDFFVRTGAEWKALVAANPFPDEAGRDPGHLVVYALKKAPKAADVGELRAAIKGRETVAAVGKQLYAIYPDGIGRSKLAITVIEKALGTRGTGRNWNTVTKLAAMAEESARS